MTPVDGGPSAPADPRNEALADFAHRVLGTGVHLEDMSRRVGRLSIVWRVTAGDGRVHFVKQHESRNLFERELRAYERWVPQLHALPGIALAELVAVDAGLGAIVLTAVPPGTLASELDAGADAHAAVHRRAGRFLRALHDLPLPEPAPDVVAHMRAMIERYVVAYRDCIEPARFDAIVARLDEGRPFAGVPFVCAHRDCSPRNWIVAADGTLGVFDWERAQPDVWLLDVTRMEFDVWPAHPGLRAAFFEGYGTARGAAAREQLRLATLIHAVASVGWATLRADTHFAALGRATVERLTAR